MNDDHRRADGPEPPASAQDSGPTSPSDQGEDEPQAQITLDRYLSQRRAPSRSMMSQIVMLVFMLAALVMIFIYKDRCGLMVSDFFGNVGDPPSGSTAPAQQPGR